LLFWHKSKQVSLIAKMTTLLITGTDPNVGQRQFTAMLTVYWQRHHGSIDRLGLLALQPPLNMEETWQMVNAFASGKDCTILTDEVGFGSLVATETTVADLAWDWRLPTVLVVPLRSGTIGQAVAHVALARQARCHLKAIVLCCLEPRTEFQEEALAAKETIQNLTQTYVLGTIPYLGSVEDQADPEKLAQVSSAFDLEWLLS
jgi:dethiobiotin synthetase